MKKIKKEYIVLGVIIVLAAMCYFLLRSGNADRNIQEKHSQIAETENVGGDKELSSKQLSDPMYSLYNLQIGDNELESKMYTGVFYVRKNVFGKYNVANKGDKVSFFNHKTGVASADVKDGETQLVLESVEIMDTPPKSMDLSASPVVDGFKYVALNMRMYNCIGEDYVEMLRGYGLGIINDNYIFMGDKKYEGIGNYTYGKGFGLAYIEYGDDCVLCENLAPSGNVMSIVPSQNIKYDKVWVLIPKGESVSFTLYYHIPKEYVTNADLALGDGLTGGGGSVNSAKEGNYTTSGFRIYVNK